MTAAQIHRAVSRVTGESARRIRRLGFNLADALNLETEAEQEERPPLLMDWDEHEHVQPEQHWRASSD